MTTDEILYDFARSIECKTVVVINPTAPFLRPTTISRVLATLKDSGDEPTVFTTTRMRKHLVVDGAPQNFEPSRRSPRTQDLAPFDYINFIVLAIARSKVLSNYERDGYCLYVSPLKFVPMTGIECQDIDDEDDFILAEAMMAK